MDLMKVLKSELETAKTILVGASLSADSSFLIHYILNDCIREGELIIFLKFENSTSHYQTVQSKFGNTMAHNSKILILDLMHYFSEKLYSEVEHSDILDQILNKVKEFSSKQPNRNLNIIIDDFSLAYLSGINQMFLNRFVHKVENISKKNKFFMNCKSFNMNQLSMNNMMFLSDVYINVNKLNIHSKDFTGKVSLVYL
jgi:KaiC/GvpD/RAD55 family RecA-like ATPase